MTELLQGKASETKRRLQEGTSKPLNVFLFLLPVLFPILIFRITWNEGRTEPMPWIDWLVNPLTVPILLGAVLLIALGVWEGSDSVRACAAAKSALAGCGFHFVCALVLAVFLFKGCC